MIAKQAGDGVAPYTSLDVPRYGADRVFRPTGFYRLRELSLPDVSQDTLYVGLDLPVSRDRSGGLIVFKAGNFFKNGGNGVLLIANGIQGMEDYGGAQGRLCS